MDRILYTAMSGAKQSMDQQSVVSHNLANVDTAGFRAQLHAMRAVPVQGEATLATRTSVAASTPGSDFSQGPVMRTGRELDVALEGDAWLAVQTPERGLHPSWRPAGGRRWPGHAGRAPGDGRRGTDHRAAGLACLGPTAR